jgi:hypothetical protein
MIGVAICYVSDGDTKQRSLQIKGLPRQVNLLLKAFLMDVGADLLSDDDRSIFVLLLSMKCFLFLRKSPVSIYSRDQIAWF